jgi:hypothetical protein
VQHIVVFRGNHAYTVQVKGECGAWMSVSAIEQQLEQVVEEADAVEDSQYPAVGVMTGTDRYCTLYCVLYCVLSTVLCTVYCTLMTGTDRYSTTHTIHTLHLMAGTSLQGLLGCAEAAAGGE